MKLRKLERKILKDRRWTKKVESRFRDLPESKINAPHRLTVRAEKKFRHLFLLMMLHDGKIKSYDITWPRGRTVEITIEFPSSEFAMNFESEWNAVQR